MKTFEEVKAIKEKFEKELLAKDDVVGVGIGKKKEAYGKPETFCIRIYVSGGKPLESYKKSFPDKLDDIEVEVVISGRFDAQYDTQN